MGPPPPNRSPQRGPPPPGRMGPGGPPMGNGQGGHDNQMPPWARNGPPMNGPQMNGPPMNGPPMNGPPMSKLRTFFSKKSHLRRVEYHLKTVGYRSG